MRVAVVPNTENDRCSAAVWNDDSATENSAGHADPSDIVVLHEDVELDELARMVGPGGAQVHCALALSASPRQRRQLLQRLADTQGFSQVTAIESPVAALAHTLSMPPATDDVIFEGPVLQVVAVADGCDCGVVVANTSTRTLGAISLVAGRDDLESTVSKGLRGPLNGSIATTGPWSTLRRSVGTVTTVGLSAAQRALFDDTFGPGVDHRQNVEATVRDGLVQLWKLAPWTALWPTTRVHLGHGWTRQPGPLRGGFEEHITRLRSGATVRFSSVVGQPVPVRAGSVSATGCSIPDRLGTQPRLRLVDDGRLLMYGPSGVRPFAAQLEWPIPGSGRGHVSIRSASSASIELADPEIDVTTPSAPARSERGSPN